MKKAQSRPGQLRDRREWNPGSPDLDYPINHNALWSFINGVGQKLNKHGAKIGEDLATCLLYRLKYGPKTRGSSKNGTRIILESVH